MASHKPKGRLISVQGFSLKTDDYEEYQITKDAYFRSKPIVDKGNVIRFDSLVNVDCINLLGVNLPSEDYVRIPKNSPISLIGHLTEKEIISNQESYWYYVKLYPPCPGGYPTKSVEGWIFGSLIEKRRK
ncbi:hypothetical protein EHQ12_05235 [Leptospira gomenensis]|uniref:Uncharacterized protein n=1 Tax=Leptospira gomenensis TaxID=2484974 RepID=A0A5F1YIQ9_9LEPT|nr:hypothetical protein EHQ17_01935 [Leptospira gomenensis]TGK42011.1 hypothetical protein EHQ12_05235 [Leptospira gomenensis]TGK52267.1 hypothetical protein EHQ07_01355 [Leptospira gomenensis]TGK55796.1 hypothetical protein EHQ13_16575 [Leptospira gomenensis]